MVIRTPLRLRLAHFFSKLASLYRLIYLLLPIGDGWLAPDLVNELLHELLYLLNVHILLVKHERMLCIQMHNDFVH